MPQFTAMNESIETISGRLLKGCYNLEPFYQRGEVWDKAHKQLLIDSIINDIAIPPIYLRRLEGSDDNPFTHECLDGKQRLVAIKEFVQNRYGLDNGITFDKMAPRDKRAFLLKNVTIIDYMELDDDEILEIFSRLNNGMTLTQGELMQGVNPLIRGVMIKFEKKQSQMENLIKTKRNGAFEIYVRCLFLEFHRSLRNITTDVIRNFVRDKEKKINGELMQRFEIKMERYIDFLIKNSDEIRASVPIINKFKFVMGYFGLFHLEMEESIVLNFLKKYDTKHVRMSSLKEMLVVQSKWFSRNL